MRRHMLKKVKLSSNDFDFKRGLNSSYALGQNRRSEDEYSFLVAQQDSCED